MDKSQPEILDIAEGKRLLAVRESLRGTEINTAWWDADDKLMHWLRVNGARLIAQSPDRFETRATIAA